MTNQAPALPHREAGVFAVLSVRVVCVSLPTQVSPPEFAFSIKVFFLACVVIAGVFGARTVSPRILVVQAVPAALALLLTVLARA